MTKDNEKNIFPEMPDDDTDDLGNSDDSGSDASSTLDWDSSDDDRKTKKKSKLDKASLLR